MTGKIFSPGKLLLTSEYFVLDGALALAVPTLPGQEFFFLEKEDGNSEILWEALHQGKPWLKTRISYKNWEILEANIPEAAAFVVKVLKNVQLMSREKFQNNTSYHLKTNLQFPADFGLGSSSTMINNLAEWSGTDAFELNEKSLGGSGYDIAVAREKSPVLYRNLPGERSIERIDFQPEFRKDLIFVHLNRKQDSREGIQLYRSREKPVELISEFSELTKKALTAESIEVFDSLMKQHERILSGFLQLETVKDKYFGDCPVFVKSLGAWGGDFVMTSAFNGYKDYFEAKGFTTVLTWNELIGT